MRFGPLPLAEAEGAILAHSLRFPGVSLRKGRRLTADDVRALADAGLERVVVARLDPGDVEENEAAHAVAEVVRGEHATVARPFTGRVNLHADAAGLCRIDREGVDRLNRVHEAVTLGTLPAFEPVRARQMVATVKIIPFAVPPDVFERCLGVARESGPLVSVAPFRPLRVRLIQTRLPGTPEKMLDKTVEVTRRRIEAFGGGLMGEVRCPHDEAGLEDTIRAVLHEPMDLLLIAGASAITDRRDVLPAAIVAAGGCVDHFGMPVDPGNLLLLARHRDGLPILGLPGCCRSPKVNGLDWVLNRLAAGLEVRPEDIMGMGVGGLLTEIPSRPQPREVPPPAEEEEAEEAAPPPSPKVAAIVLAAGQSRRMGTVNKLLAGIDGQPMLGRVVDAVRASKADPVIVVTGHERERVEEALARKRVRLVHNPDYALGLSTSLRAGIDALPDDVDGVLICLGDMPLTRKKQLNRLIDAFDPAAGRAIVLPTVRGKRGNPVLWGRAFFDEMRGLAGDVGARHLIGQYADRVTEVEMDDDAALVDIDTPAALAALTGADR